MERKGGPGRRGTTRRGLAFPGASLGGTLGGTPLTSYSKAKGRRTECRAPFSFLKVPTHSEGEISNGDKKLRLG